jgi:hypothetical protein
MLPAHCHRFTGLSLVVLVGTAGTADQLCPALVEAVALRCAPPSRWGWRGRRDRSALPCTSRSCRRCAVRLPVIGVGAAGARARVVHLADQKK